MSVKTKARRLWIKIQRVVLWLFTPVQRIMQRIGRKETIMTEAIALKIISLSEPGDILQSYEAQRLTSIFIKGQWDHAAIVTNNMTVMEAVGDMWVKDMLTQKMINIGGVREVPYMEWLLKKDHVRLSRPDLPRDKRFAAGNQSLSYKGKAYDYLFTIGSSKIYCSELVFLCYKIFVHDFMKHIVETKIQILPIYYDEIPEIFNTRG